MDLPTWNPKHPRDVPVDESYSEEQEHVQLYLANLFGIPNFTTKWKYYAGLLSDSKQCVYYESRVCISSQESISFCLAYGQSNDIWRRERRMRITASVCYDLYTYYMNDDGTRDWPKKLSPIFHPLEMRLSQLTYGKETESKALNSYKQKNIGKTVTRMGLVIPPTAPYLGCSPDAVVLDNQTLIEIKCPVLGKYKSIAIMPMN